MNRLMRCLPALTALVEAPSLGRSTLERQDCCPILE
jgi:hypothetical protein